MPGEVPESEQNKATFISTGEKRRDRGELRKSPSAIPGTNENTYKERRKFSTSCICERLSELNLRVTLLASDPFEECAWMCLQQVGGPSVMQEEQALAKTPKRSRTELVRTCRP